MVTITTNGGFANGVASGLGYTTIAGIPENWEKISEKTKNYKARRYIDTVYNAPDGKYELQEYYAGDISCNPSTRTRVVEVRMGLLVENTGNASTQYGQVLIAESGRLTQNGEVSGVPVWREQEYLSRPSFLVSRKYLAEEMVKNQTLMRCAFGEDYMSRLVRAIRPVPNGGHIFYEVK